MRRVAPVPSKSNADLHLFQYILCILAIHNLAAPEQAADFKDKTWPGLTRTLLDSSRVNHSSSLDTFTYLRFGVCLIGEHRAGGAVAPDAVLLRYSDKTNLSAMAVKQAINLCRQLTRNSEIGLLFSLTALLRNCAQVKMNVKMFTKL